MSTQTDTIRKEEVLARVEEERRIWDRLIAEIGSDRMSEPGFSGDWTMKDVIGHLNAWRRRTLQRLDALRRGTNAEPAEWPSEFTEIADEDEQVQKINAWFYEQDKERPLADILTESRKQFDEFRDIIDSLSEDQLNAPATQPWQEGESVAQMVIDGSLFGHFHDEHETDVRAKLASSQ